MSASSSPGKLTQRSGVMAFNVLVVIVAGGQHVTSYFQSMISVTCLLCAACFAAIPLVAFEAYWLRDAAGTSWHERYGSTPVPAVLLVLYYAFFWSMVAHTVELMATQRCDICDGNPASGKRFFIAAYWLHVIPSCVIALFSPLQFTPWIRKMGNYAVHRWVGRLVLLASVLHQASATVLFLSEIILSKADHAGIIYKIYVSGFVPKNILAWTSMVMGFWTARQKRFAEHGRWMYRLGAMWVITVAVAHLIIYPVGFLVGSDWKYAVGEWTEWLFVIPMEVYIRRSGRFPLPGKEQPPVSMEHSQAHDSEQPGLASPSKGKAYDSDGHGVASMSTQACSSRSLSGKLTSFISEQSSQAYDSEDPTLSALERPFLPKGATLGA